MDINTISPTTRRAVITYASRENIDFMVALECLINEGIKAICVDTPKACPLVHNPVNKHV